PYLASSPLRFAARWPLAGARRSPRPRGLRRTANSPRLGRDRGLAAGSARRRSLPWILCASAGGRWGEHEGKAFLDLGDLGLDVGGDLLGAAVALVERLQDRKGNGIIRRIGLLCGVETGQPDHMGDTICAERDILHPLQHG